MAESGRTHKRPRRRLNKAAIWAQFREANEEEKTGIECLYDTSQLKDGPEHCTCCGTALVLADEGLPVCPSATCGVIHKEVIDRGAEWRYYGDDSSGADPTRAGPPINPLLEQSSWGCRVVLSYRSTYEQRKIRRYTEWQSMPYREKARYDEFQRITAHATAAGLPRVLVDEAMRYHKRISEAKTFRGVNRDGIIAASIYLAARINGCPRTSREIATIFHLDNTSATRGCKNAMSIINGLERNMANADRTALCETTPLAFIGRYCSRLNLSDELTNLCRFVAIRIQRHDLVPENTPHSIAAGVVFFVAQACSQKVSKGDVHKISEISEVTINKCFRKLDAMRTDLLPMSVVAKYAPPGA
tara:strand:- start:1678 stop:2754 length:1077 start_codon:yes stop_codon:yes gene_type:complete